MIIITSITNTQAASQVRLGYDVIGINIILHTIFMIFVDF